MFAVELDLVAQFIVVLVAALDFKVDKKAQVIIEAKKIVLLSLVLLEGLLESGRIAGSNDLGRSTVKAVTVFRIERLDVDAVLFMDNTFRIVLAAALWANHLSFFDGDLNVIGH